MNLASVSKFLLHLFSLALLFGAASPSQAFLLPPSLRVEIDTPRGEDIGKRVNAAVARLGKKQGTILVTTEGTIRTPIRLGVGQSLNFGPGLWICATAPCITLENASQVLGAGVYRTRLQMDKGTAGPMMQTASYTELVALSEKAALARDNSLDGDRKHLPGAKYVRIKDLTLDGQRNAQTVRANGVEIYGFWFWVEDVSIERFTGDGLVTQFIPGADVHPEGNDAMESYFTRLKLISNGENGWTFRGPHDSIVSGLVAANNGAWGIDVQHREGYYSGGGLMLTNTHLYGNQNGMRTEAGANILAFGLESEANKGVGLLLRSNDSVIQGTFYANGSYGVQFGDGESYAGANSLTVQVHNNRKAQIYWLKSAGYNMVAGSVFPNDNSQKYFESMPTKHDQVLTGGPYAVQHFPGGIKFDSDGNVYGAKIKRP